MYSHPSGKVALWWDPCVGFEPGRYFWFFHIFPSFHFSTFLQVWASRWASFFFFLNLTTGLFRTPPSPNYFCIFTLFVLFSFHLKQWMYSHPSGKVARWWDPCPGFEPGRYFCFFTFFLLSIFLFFAGLGLTLGLALFFF